MPCVEFCTFKASPEYIADHTVIEDAIKGVTRYNGAISTFVGFEVEDPTVGYIVAVWETYEDHITAQTQPSFEFVTNNLKKALWGGDFATMKMLHFEMTDGPEAALSNSVTDFTFMALKEGRDKADVEPFIANVGEVIDVSKGFHHGQCRENEKLTGVFIGWDSIEAHLEAAKDPKFVEMVKAAQDVVEIGAKHSSMRRIR